MAPQRKDAATDHNTQPDASLKTKSEIAASARRDIADVLRNWDHEPGTINVRKIVGNDGREKLQMRLELGVLQMEIAGRPDGVRPHDRQSLLHHHVHRLRKHKKRCGSPWGFSLNPDECAALRSEAAMYYQRYLSFFVLDEFDAVARDTKRNLQVMSFCRQYAATEADRNAMEGFRPYLLMMHYRAIAAVAVERGEFKEAEQAVRKGLRRIRQAYHRAGSLADFGSADEVKVLRRVLDALAVASAKDPCVSLEQQLRSAIACEDYEHAAFLRDELAKLRLA